MKLFGILALLSAPAFAANYYIDYAVGSDSNNGTSKTTPWKRAPGMVGCSGVCASAAPKPGDKFLFKGGVTWPGTTMQWQWEWSGSSAGSIYLGVDKTWFSGSAWARPILNGGNVRVGATNRYLWVTASYIIVDNFEFTGFREDTQLPYCQNTYMCLNTGSNSLEIMNNYFHGWTHTSYPSTNDDGQCITGDTAWPSQNANSSIHDNVFHGGDTLGNSMGALHGGPETIYNNYVYNMTNGYVGEYTNFHDNTVLNINPSYNPTQHENGLEINFSGTSYVYNNVFAHIYHGLAVWLGPNLGTTHYFYNNLMYDITTTNVLDLGYSLTSPSGNMAVFNNTIWCGAAANPVFICAAGIDKTVTSVDFRNNHWISNYVPSSSAVWNRHGNTPVTETNSVLQTVTQAASSGFGLSQTYVLSPSGASAATVGKGANLTSLCGTLAGLCRDSTLGVGYDSASRSVVLPRRASVARPATGAWDVGAYSFGVAAALPPTPGGLANTVIPAPGTTF